MIFIVILYAPPASMLLLTGVDPKLISHVEWPYHHLVYDLFEGIYMHIYYSRESHVDSDGED